jgi:GTP1/Obg family GTP-binding protein
MKKIKERRLSQRKREKLQKIKKDISKETNVLGTKESSFDERKTEIRQVFTSLRTLVLQFCREMLSILFPIVSGSQSFPRTGIKTK